jgi:hypothetical protein
MLHRYLYHHYHYPHHHLLLPLPLHHYHHRQWLHLHQCLLVGYHLQLIFDVGVNKSNGHCRPISFSLSLQPALLVHLAVTICLLLPTTSIMIANRNVPPILQYTIHFDPFQSFHSSIR